MSVKYGVTGGKTSRVHIYSGNAAKQLLLPHQAACGVKLSHGVSGGLIARYGLCATCRKNEAKDA